MLDPLEPPDRSTLEQVLKHERMVTIGRLIPSIVHEINNPLQAIRGALTLAMDDLENKDELQEYITISQQEIVHISGLLNQVRLIYRLENDQPDMFPLSILFRDGIDMTREEAMRQKVRLQNRLPSNSPLVEGVYNHIYIVILRAILAFIDFIGAAGGGDLTVTAVETSSQLQISFVGGNPIPAQVPDNSSSSLKKQLSQFDLTGSLELVKANGGSMDFQPCDDHLYLRIDLPRVT
jgi:signal transduction histidine kinase